MGFVSLKQGLLVGVVAMGVIYCHGSHGVPTHTVNPNATMEATIATIIIGLLPILFLPLIPISGDNSHQPYLKILLAFASGGLMGDVFLHLIPHTILDYVHHFPSNHATEDALSIMGIYILLGFLLFFLLEKYMRSLSKKPKDDRQAAGMLNLAADTVHNMTDGLALAAAFSASSALGLSTTAAILFHELPHEVGDYAILLKAGYTKKQAMVAQVFTAIGALVGCAMGIFMTEAISNGVFIILPITAGGFLYISTVSIIPELLDEVSFNQSICEAIGFGFGVLLMIGVGLLES